MKYWVVRLIKIPVINDYASNYFPRKFYYKRDARILVKEIEKKGGLAIICR